MKMVADAFSKVISQFKQAKINVIRPGGNYGDLLIYLGLEKFLKQKGFKYIVYRYQEKISLPIIFAKKCLLKTTKLFDFITEECSDYMSIKLQQLLDRYYLARLRAKFPPGSPTLIEGGGGMNDLWYNAIRLLKILLYDNPNSTIIVAPQSYYFRATNFPSIFKNFRGKIYLFSRERYSYTLLKRMNLPRNVEVLLSHDTTFYLNREDFPHGSEKHNLLCLRRDKESVIDEYLRKKIKEILHRKLDQVLESDVSSEAKNFQDFVTTIGSSRMIFTDRLHVATLGAIMGKEVFLFPNIYWKNKGVYEYSLAKFDNVTFIEDPKNLRILSKLLSRA